MARLPKPGHKSRLVKGTDVYSKEEAEVVGADLQPLVGRVITRISKHDINPEHNPQMPERFRKQGAGEVTPNT